MPAIPLFEKKTFALYGMSRQKAKFGNTLYKHLSGHGYTLYPLHPEAETLQGVKAYRALSELPGPVDGAIINLPPAQTLAALRDLAEAGITEVFLQQGSESEEVLALCRQLSLHAYYKSCAILNSSPTGAHALHAFFARLFKARAREV